MEVVQVAGMGTDECLPRIQCNLKVAGVGFGMVNSRNACANRQGNWHKSINPLTFFIVS